MRMSKFCCRNSESDPETRTPLPQRFSCGVGSVMIDITRQLLFSFRLVLFMNVLGLSAANAGWLMLYGQIALAVTSPISAFLQDRIDVPFLSRKIGRRKSWHLIGTVFVAIVLPLYFSSCFPCHSDRGQWQLMIYIPVLNTILALSFSLIEIGHLSLIPTIAKDQDEAIELNAWRTTFTFLSGITTLAVAWVIFGQDSSDQLSAESSMDFTVMTLILVGIGLAFSLIFHIGTKEISHGLNNGQSTKNTATLRKTSFIPSHSILQAMTFLGTVPYLGLYGGFLMVLFVSVRGLRVQKTRAQEKLLAHKHFYQSNSEKWVWDNDLLLDVHYNKERMRDRFIDSLKAKNGPVTEERGPVRKKSFARHFVNALFTIDEDEEDKATGELPSNDRQRTPMCTDVTPPSKVKTQDDVGMLNDVKQLPRERKISVLMSILNGLMGTDTATSENLPTSSKETKTCNEMDSSDKTKQEESNELNEHNGRKRKNAIGTKSITFSLASSESLGVDNKGLDCNETELEPCYPDQITVNNGGEVLSSNVHSDSLEVNPGVSNDPESALPVSPAPKTVRAWLKDPNLYKVAIIFASTNVLKDISYAYLPLFLIYKVQVGKDATAYLPLIMLVSATVSSGISKKLVGIMGSKCLFILSAFFVIGAGLWFYFINQSNKAMIIPAVILLGFGFSAMLVNALSFAAELIGENKSSSGVVFAVMALMAQLTGGVLVSAIQKMFPKGNNSEDCEECGDYVRHVFSFVPGSLAAISVMVVLLSQSSKIICKRNVPETDTSEKSEGTIDTRF